MQYSNTSQYSNTAIQQYITIQYTTQYNPPQDHCRGMVRARKNLRLVQRVCTLWAQAHDHLKGQLPWMKHVYGHSGHAWNDRADELAERGKGGTPANGRTGGGKGGVDDNEATRRWIGEQAGRSLMAQRE